MKEVEILRAGKAYIADKTNWSPSGSGDGKGKVCAIVALSRVTKDPCLHGTPYNALATLGLACNELYGHDCIAYVNDFGERRPADDAIGYGAVDRRPPITSEDDRHKMVMAIYDKAIELAEKQNECSGTPAQS